MMSPELTDDAQGLLESLQGGDGREIAEPSVYPGMGAFSYHAIAYFHNAALLCKRPEAHDFVVFGALYFVRHGLELWLKCLAQRKAMDAVLDAIRGGKDLDEVAKIAEMGSNTKKDQLIYALCVRRNIERGLEFPETTQEEIGERFARESLSVRRICREDLEISWTVPIQGHRLKELWRAAEWFISSRYGDALRSSDGSPMSPKEVKAACELLGTLDPDGDAFRYPCALPDRKQLGRPPGWFVSLPPINLRKLGAFAQSLEAAVRAYDGL